MYRVRVHPKACIEGTAARPCLHQEGQKAYVIQTRLQGWPLLPHKRCRLLHGCMQPARAASCRTPPTPAAACMPEYIRAHPSIHAGFPRRRT